ncbi:hypothetical protein CH379_005075 [Leptospira ellisii]|uniref:Uncharacterized protein n=1 Tax=Leptospira ellisii TaxID=2023197 RepID=A0A2N0B8N8_9LEPT|nr:hypothetical protein [Leptospira ellisii]MDV6234999.1 hypothetical protein [Leptospira ellisii]PJZ92896.1 hypothetical protein CH379_10725 [Leptospira ellisii]
MLEYTELEKKILSIVVLEDRDARKLGRILQDAALVTGMTEDEIVEFIPFGLEEEIKTLKTEYNFSIFKKALISKLTKRSYSAPGLSAPIPETIRPSY